MSFLLGDGDQEGFDALLALLVDGNDTTPLDEANASSQSVTERHYTTDADDASAVHVACDDSPESLLQLAELICDDAPASPVGEVQSNGATTNQHALSSTSDNSSSPVFETPAVTATHSGASRPKKQRSWDPNRARKEKHAELLYLREQVAQLKTRLGELKAVSSLSTALTAPVGSSLPAMRHPAQQQQTAGSSRPLDLTAPPSGGNDTNDGSSWKDVARREQCARLQAEADNARMKLVLENQISIAKSLETILSATASTTEILQVIQRGSGGDGDARPSSPSSTAQRRSAVLDDLLAGFDSAFADVNDLFSPSSAFVPGSERPRLRSHVYYSDARGLQLEVVPSDVLPFDVHTTSAAVWHYFTVSKQNVPYRVYGESVPKIVETTDDTHIEQFAWHVQLRGTPATFHTTQVLRRFVERERVVVAWRGVIDTVEFAGERVAGLQFFERGYNVISTPSAATVQAAFGDTRSAGDCALLQSCYVITPTMTDAVPRRRLGAVTDFVLSATAGGLARSYRMIESVLTHGKAEPETIEVEPVSRIERVADDNDTALVAIV